MCSWFDQFAKRWPKPHHGGELLDFLRALNVLRVTKSKRERDLQQRAPEVFERHERVIAAIQTLVNDLPKMIDTYALGVGRIRSPDELFKLATLVASAMEAQNVIKPLRPIHKEMPWHETARLVAWHLRRLADISGVTELSDGKDSPLVRLIAAVLKKVEGLSLGLDAISKALDERRRPNGAPLPESTFSEVPHVVVA